MVSSLKLKVYYDEAMLGMYNGNEAKVEQKLRSVMVYVEEMYHEIDTLTTKVVIDAKNVKIEKAPRGDWKTNWSDDLR